MVLYIKKELFGQNIGSMLDLLKHLFLFIELFINLPLSWSTGKTFQVQKSQVMLLL